MQKENELSHRDSLNIIEQMISAARNDHRETGLGWLVWGWLLFIASAASAILLLLRIYGYISWIWTSVPIIGLSIHFSLRIKNKNKRQVKTYVEEILEKFGTGFYISLFAMIAGAFILNKNASTFGYYYILYAFWMFIHGSAIRFKPLLIGAVFNWIAAILIFLVNDILYVMLISAVAILIGYLIPGYMLRNQYNKKSKTIS